MRQIKILEILSNHTMKTADELAVIFEVSKRTILRDMDSLLGQGYPIEVIYGRNGGFRLEAGYQFNIETLTHQQHTRLTHLMNAFAVHPNDYGLRGSLNENPWIEYDVSGWNATDKNLFQDIEQAIFNNESFEFMYYSAYGTLTQRNVFPKTLIFKDRFWYLKAWDHDKEKHFKLKRMFRNTLEIPSDNNLMECKVLVQRNKIFKLLDECYVTTIDRVNDTHAHVVFYVPYTDWLVDFILSFGSTIEFLQPEFIRPLLKLEIEKMQSRY